MQHAKNNPEMVWGCLEHTMNTKKILLNVLYFFPASNTYNATDVAFDSDNSYMCYSCLGNKHHIT